MEQVALYREAGNEAAEMMAMGNVAHCEITLGRFEEAERHARDALQRLDAIGAQGHGGHVVCQDDCAAVLVRPEEDHARSDGWVRR